jgi:hypothetical protein
MIGTTRRHYDALASSIVGDSRRASILYVLQFFFFKEAYVSCATE